MSESRQNTPVRSSVSRRRIAYRLAGVMLLLGSVAFVYVFCFPQPQVAQGILQAREDGDGVVREEGDLSDRPWVAGQATALQSNTSKSAATTRSSGGQSFLPSGSLALFCDSDHLLLQRVSLQLYDKLKSSGEFEHLVLVPAGAALVEQQPLPLLFGSLTLKSLSETGVTPRTNYRVELQLDLGNTLAHSHHTVVTNDTPPISTLHSTVNLELNGVLTGVETSGARYTALANELAKHLAESILSIVQDPKQVRMPSGEELAAFYPSVQPIPEMPWLKKVGARVRYQGSSFMRPAIAGWTFTSDVTGRELSELLQPILKEEGWTVDLHSTGEGADAATPASFRATRGLEVLVLAPREPAWKKPVSPGPQQYDISYETTMPREEVINALKTSLGNDVSERTLVAFVNLWYECPEEIRDYFARHPPRHAASLQQLARQAHRNRDDGMAQKYFQQAYVLDALLRQGDGKSGLKTLAKEIGIDDFPDVPDFTVLTELGGLDLREATDATTNSLDGDSPVLQLPNQDDSEQFLILKPERRKNGQWRVGYVLLNWRANGNFSQSSPGHDVELSSDKDVEVATALGDVDVHARRGETPREIRLIVHRRK